MLYTLKSARKLLAESTNAYGQTDLRDQINRAIATLAGMKGWERLRKVLRFPCIGPKFTLPQGCAGLVRLCVNGRPASVRAQDFTFIHSGPGDAARPPSGFVAVRTSNVTDAGTEPVMFQPNRPCSIGAWSAKDLPSGQSASLAVRGIAPDGRHVSFSIPVHRTPWHDDNGAAYGDPFSDSSNWSDETVQCITEVVLELPSGYGEYVSLFARDYVSGAAVPLALYNPEVEVPVFRHYEIAGVPPMKPVELLAEVRLEPLPLVKDTDVLPFENISPVEWTIRGDWYMKSNEPDAAQKYYSMAAQWLQAQEVVDTTVQTSIVVNSSFVNSPGEISLESENI